jgi:O-antigen/teichoic acid export membrane protein
MFRKIVSYVPSTVVPSAVSFVMLYVYTRILSPAAFGSFVFVFSAVLLLQNSLFYAIPVAATRFYPEAVAQGRERQFLAECYVLFLALCAGIPVLAAIISLLPIPHPAPLVWLAVPLVMARSAVGLSQSVRRISDQVRWYNAIECAHAVLGFGFGLTLISVFGPSAEPIVLGLLLAALVCLIPSAWELTLPFRMRQAIRRTDLRRLLAFAFPLLVVDIMVCLLQLSDRLLLGSLGGAAALGLYGAAFNLVDRPLSLICTAITTATFPMAVQALQHGREAGRLQAGRNGVVLLALLLPACVGLTLTRPYLVTTLIGPEFRSGVVTLIPIVCAAALLRGFSTHFIDHAFHLGGRPAGALWVYGPAALANIVLNVLLIPTYGAWGAACSALICQGGAVIIGWVVGRGVFPIWLSVPDVTKIVIAVVPMALLLHQVPFPATWGGLTMAVSTGAAFFTMTALLLDVGGVRRQALGFIRTQPQRLQ